MRFTFISLLVIVLLAGCTSTPNVRVDNSNDDTTEQSTSVSPINKNSKLCVFVPADGRDLDTGDMVIRGSGQEAAQATYEVLKRYFPHTKLEPDTEKLNKAIKQARTEGYDYIVYPKILKWTNHATFWSGIPNQLAVNLRVYDLHKKTIVDSLILENKSSEFAKPGAQTVDLLYKPLNQAANKIIASAN